MVFHPIVLLLVLTSSILSAPIDEFKKKGQVIDTVIGSVLDWFDGNVNYDTSFEAGERNAIVHEYEMISTQMLTLAMI